MKSPFISCERLNSQPVSGQMTQNFWMQRILWWTVEKSKPGKCHPQPPEEAGMSCQYDTLLCLGDTRILSSAIHNYKTHAEHAF